MLLADFGVVGFEYHLREVKKLFTVDIATAVDFDAGEDEDDQVDKTIGGVVVSRGASGRAKCPDTLERGPIYQANISNGIAATCAGVASKRMSVRTVAQSNPAKMEKSTAIWAPGWMPFPFTRAVANSAVFQRRAMLSYVSEYVSRPSKGIEVCSSVGGLTIGIDITSQPA